MTPPRPATADRPALAWPVIAPLVAAKVIFQLATAARYSAHRDEFYYLESGYHLAWGYVDNPPLVPVIYRVDAAVFGHSVAALGVAPALVGGLYILVAALLVRELGGGRAAQTLAAVVAALGPIYLTTSHFLSTVSLDLVFWAIGSLLVLRMIRTGDLRLWIPIGVTCGLGLLNKDTMAFWVAATLFGLAVTPERRILASPYLLGGVAIAVALEAPNLVWEAQHHWATLEFLRHLQSDNGATDRVQFVPLQLGVVTLGGTVVWVIALNATWRDALWRRLRWLGAGYVFAFVVLLALGGKSYYLGSWYLPLVAVGAVVIERRWARRGRWLILGVVTVTGLLTAPIFTPILPESTAVALGLDHANKDLGGMLGWPRVVDQIAGAYRSLPAAERARAVIFTGDYSEAGAVDFFGPADGLPAAISGHNSFWLWGYGHPAPGATVIVVGWPAAFVTRYWADVSRYAIIGVTGPAVDPQERGNPIWICRGQRVPWSVIWPQAKSYD